MIHRLLWLAGGVATLAVATACGDSPFGDFGVTVDAQISSGDTAVFEGSTTEFTAIAIYDVGPGDPQTVAWAVTDTVKIRLEVTDGDAFLTALDTGQSRLIARINEDFLDTVVVTVVQPGLVRWRRALPAAPGLHPALDDSGHVQVLDQNGGLWAFNATGDTTKNVASCASAFGPAVRSQTRAVTATGPGCTMQHEHTGIVQWTFGVGAANTSPALAIDGATIVLSLESDQGAGVEAVVVSRLSGLGQPVWRDTLATSADEVAPNSAPAIATNGDIYVTWRTAAGTSRLTRYTSAGTLQWTIDLPDSAHLTAPAMGGNRIAVGHIGGIAVYDTAGTPTPAWSATFPTATTVSSPIIGPNGNYYIQTVDGLYSYDAAGALRWSADSLGADAAGQTAGIGAPTMLLTGDLVVSCNGALCAVRSADGSLVWRAPVSQIVGSAVVDLDGQIYVTSLANEVIAIWGNRLPAFNGWPTEGGDQLRSRQRL